MRTVACCSRKMHISGWLEFADVSLWGIAQATPNPKPLDELSSCGTQRLNKFLAAIEQNPSLLEKRVLPSQLPKNCGKPMLLKVDKEPGLLVAITVP